MEPLLRWLQQGGRGYHYGCLSTAENKHTNCSSLAFADDLALIADDIKHLQAQCHKLTLYSQWAGMDIKHTKCAATGKLYSSIKNNAALAGINLNNTLKQQLNTLSLDSHSIPYLPPSSSYKYLGMWINMDLN